MRERGALRLDDEDDLAPRQVDRGRGRGGQVADDVRRRLFGEKLERTLDLPVRSGRRPEDVRRQPPDGDRGGGGVARNLLRKAAGGNARG